MLLWSEHQGGAPARCEGLLHERCEIGQRYDWLLRLAVLEGSGPNHEGALPDGLGQRCVFACGLQQMRCSDGGLRFTPMGKIGSCNRQMLETEVCHGARHSADVERVARRDEHYI